MKSRSMSSFRAAAELPDRDDPAEPTCGKCGKVMTRENARLRPELFLHDACLPDGLKPAPRPPEDPVELAAQIGYETAITRMGYADDDETHCWANQGGTLKDDWRAYARNMLALTQARLEKAEADRDRLLAALKEMRAGVKDDSPDMWQRVDEAIDGR